MARETSSPNLALSAEEVKPFIGKHLLVGITHRGLDGNADSLEQFHGTIERVNLREGLVLKLHGTTDERCLPPDLSRLSNAAPGQYRLKGTGEVVIDPDYLATWNLYPKGYKGDDL